MPKGLPRVTEVLRGVGLIDMSHVPVDILDRALKFGTALHKACELNDLGTLDFKTLSNPLIPYLASWQNFVRDYKITFKPEEIERQLISKRGFKGTPDRFTMVNRKFTIIDLKSSTAMTSATALQLAAYQILAEENIDQKVKQRLGVQLTETGVYKITNYTKMSDMTVFLSCLNLYVWKKENL